MNATDRKADVREFITLCKDAARRTKTIPSAGCPLAVSISRGLVKRLGELACRLEKKSPIRYSGQVLPPPDDYFTDFMFVDPHGYGGAFYRVSSRIHGVDSERHVYPGDLDRVAVYLESWILVAESWLSEEKKSPGRKGRPRKENTKIAREMFLQGQTVDEVTERLGMSAENARKIKSRMNDET